MLSVERREKAATLSALCPFLAMLSAVVGAGVLGGVHLMGIAVLALSLLLFFSGLMLGVVGCSVLAGEYRCSVSRWMQD